MAHALDIAGLVFNASGAVMLAVCSAWTGSAINPDGSVTVGGIPGLTDDQSRRMNIRRYRIQHYGMPAGWLLFFVGFILQLLAFL